MKRSRNGASGMRLGMVTKLATAGASIVVLVIGAGAPAQAISATTSDQRSPWRTAMENIPSSEYAADNAAIANYEKEHPLDIGGLSDLVRSMTGLEIPVTLNGVDGTLTGDQAQAVMDARHEAHLRSQSTRAVSPLSVPVDAFTVGFSWVPLIGDPNKDPGFYAHGIWNFDDAYVNGSAPDDMAGIQLNMNSACHSIVSTYSQANYYDGTYAGADATYLKESGVSSFAPVVGLRDQATNFMLNVDHGTVDTLVDFSCGPNTIQGAFTYEHNQDGGSVIGVSAGWGAFNVSYSGNPSTLQKSSSIADLTY